MKKTLLVIALSLCGVAQAQSLSVEILKAGSASGQKIQNLEDRMKTRDFHRSHGVDISYTTYYNNTIDLSNTKIIRRGTAKKGLMSSTDSTKSYAVVFEGIKIEAHAVKKNKEFTKVAITIKISAIDNVEVDGRSLNNVISDSIGGEVSIRPTKEYQYLGSLSLSKSSTKIENKTTSNYYIYVKLMP